MKICTAKTEVLHLSRNSDQCMLQVNGATLKQVEKFKYLGVAFKSDGRQEDELSTQIGKASALMQALHYSVVMNWELSEKAKLSIFKTVFVPILTYDHESCLGNDRKSAITSASVQNEVFTKNERSYTVRCIVYEIWKSFDIEPFLRIERSQLRWFGHVSRMPRKTPQTSFTCQCKWENTTWTT